MSRPEEWSILGVPENRVPVLRFFPRDVLALLCLEWAKAMLPKRSKIQAVKDLIKTNKMMEKWLTNDSRSNFRNADSAAEQFWQHDTFDIHPELDDESVANLSDLYQHLFSADGVVEESFLVTATIVIEDLAYSKKKGWDWIYKTCLDALRYDIAFKPEWKTDTTVSLAKNIFKTRNLKIMPILADALQDAGCTHPEIIKHLQEDECLLSDWVLWNLLDLK